ncbi:MAG TPA: DUF6190 family protein [bacterium]|nr:DUF6190 family protein [bacterium]
MNTDDIVFVDADMFLGMHSIQDSVRIACKNLFVQRLWIGVAMTLEQIGICDDVVWGFSRHVQSEYYPFMDTLHSVMAARRVPYSWDDMRRAESDPRLQELEPSNALLLARVCNEGAVLYSVQPELLERRDLPVRQAPTGTELQFPGGLEAAYRLSLALRFEEPPHAPRF